jgi:hypothetical protein
MDRPRYMNVPSPAPCHVNVAGVGKQSVWGLRIIARISIHTLTSFLKFVNTQKWWAASQSGNTRTWSGWQKLKQCGHVPKRSGSPGTLREPLSLGGIGWHNRHAGDLPSRKHVNGTFHICREPHPACALPWIGNLDRSKLMGKPCTVIGKIGIPTGVKRVR